MIEIARETDENGIFQKDIAARQDLSIKYLDQIIAALKTAQLIANVKGKKSGYILTKPSTEITLFDIYTAFVPSPQVVECLGPNSRCEKEAHCAVRPFYSGLNNLIIDYLHSFTLHQLLHNQANLEDLHNISFSSEQKCK